MARRLTKETEPKHHNVGAINDAINNVFASIYETEQAIAAAHEKHLKPLKDDRTKMWRGLKKGTAIAREDLDPAYRIKSFGRPVVPGEPRHGAFPPC